jgi:quercetin dioxygenase-like cupin family protein
MYFYDLNETPAEVATYSTAVGRVAAGQQVSVGYLRFEAGQGNEEHSHEYEQFTVVVSGKLWVRVGEEVGELGPGEAFLVPAHTRHQVRAIEATQVVSCKDILGQ